MVSSPGAGNVHFTPKMRKYQYSIKFRGFSSFWEKKWTFPAPGCKPCSSQRFHRGFWGPDLVKINILGHFPEKVRKSPKCGENHKIMDFTSSGPPKHLLNHWLEHRFQPGAGKCTFSPENRKNTSISWKSAFFSQTPTFPSRPKKYLN